MDLFFIKKFGWIFIVILLVLFVYFEEVNAYMIFRQNGNIVQVVNQLDYEQNLVAFKKNGGIDILSSKDKNRKLTAYVMNNSWTKILGTSDDMEVKNLVTSDGEMVVSRNSDSSMTLSIRDQKNPDVVFEHTADFNEKGQSKTLVYLEILPAPITLSNKEGDLFISQDKFEFKVSEEFSHFVIRSEPDNIYLVHNGKEYRMNTQPLDVGRVLNENKISFNPNEHSLQNLVYVSDPEYQITSKDKVLNIFKEGLFCEKHYGVLFDEQALSYNNTPFTSKILCLLPAR